MLRITILLVLSVTVSIALISAIAFMDIDEATEQNAAIRIDRAARAAASIVVHTYPDRFELIRSADGRPLSLRLAVDSPDGVLVYTDAYDALLKEIGLTNEGAANLFRYNMAAGTFDRFVTTFRRPDGSLPPPMSIADGHPAHANLARAMPHVGEVPVMGRMRLAYLTPIVARSGELAGALAVDVGWADDLMAARSRLKSQIFGASAVILALMAAVGVALMRAETKPLRKMAAFANSLASGQTTGPVPFADRKDEIGDLARGLSRVVDLQERLEHLAYTDPVTQMGNRARYLTDLEGAMRDMEKHPIALLHLDFDGFAKVNEAFGQASGDAVLHQAAARVARTLGSSDRIYRIAGDDFCLIRTRGADPDVSREEAARIIDALRAPIILPEGEIHLDPSIGVVLLPDHAGDPETAHRTACLALRAAKQAVEPGYAIFTDQLQARARRELALEVDLREAIKNQDLQLFYQPQICLHRQKLKGFEALARWPKEDGGFVDPGEFIPIAEKTGLIIELGAWVLDESCRQAREWIDGGVDFDYIAVNVSPIQIWQPNFERLVYTSLKRYRLPAQYLCLEVTENVFIGHDETRMMDVLKKLRGLGVKLSLDDFGTGYASLSYLNRLPFQQLKIDRTFVSQADRDPAKEKLLRVTVGLGKTLGLKVIAEGTEHAGEVQLAKEIGCDGVQGFYFGTPVPACMIEPTLARISAILPGLSGAVLKGTA